MKKFYSLLGLLMLTLSVWAAPVSREQAMGEARAFLLKNVQGKSGLKLAPAAGSTEAYYIFNVGLDAGFVVVSGDDRTPSVLGYADKGSFDLQTAPASVKAFLQGYADEIRQLPADAGQSSLPRRVTIKRAISPLIQTEWDQEEPYNMSCPVFLTGSPSATGCVATALSQIMKYYEWPAATTAAIPAYDCERAWRVDGVQKQVHVDGIAAGVKFDWDNMPFYFYGIETEEQQKAVATLMQVTGAAVKMDYADNSNGGSATSDSFVPEALTTYFNYSKNAIYVKRENYLMDEWNELIYRELKAGRPVMMGGQSSGGGHAFLVDGYSSDDYFHINWGWGGYCNGFFLLSIMNPGNNDGAGASSTQDGYSSSQDAVIGIEPDRGQAVTMSLCSMVTQLVSVKDEEVVANFYSQTPGKNIFNYGLCYLTKKGTLEPIEGYQTSVELEDSYGYTNVIFPVRNLADGTYKILPAAKLSSSQKWMSSLNPNITYVEATVKSGEVALKLVKPVVNLDVKSVKPQDTPTVKVPLALDVVVENKGDEFYGPLYIYAEGEDGIPFIAAKLGVTLPAQSTNTVTFYYVPMDAGTFKISFTHNGLNLYGETQLTVQPAPSEPSVITVEELTILNSEPDPNGGFPNAYGLLAGDIKVKNASAVDYKDRIRFQYQSYDPADFAYVEFDYYFEKIEVPAGAEKVFHFQFPYAKEGLIHWPLVYGGDGKELRTDQSDIVFLKPGAIVYYFDGTSEGKKVESSFTVPANACTVDFGTVTDITEVKSSNPNVIYFFESDVEVPAVLTQNVVHGDIAKKVVLTDGYPFLPAYNFQAEEVEYTRTFKPTLNVDNNTGWETIVLPFDVTAIKSDEKTSLSLGEFSNEVGSNAIFKDVEKIQALTPYLIGNPVGGKEMEVEFKGKNVSFPTEFTAILTGANLKMQGTMTGQVEEGALTLNAAGTDFEKADGKVAPFRAYFLPTAGATVKYDKVHIADKSVGVRGLTGGDLSKDAEWYNLSGQRVQKPTRGIYVVGGKKVVVK